MAHERLLPNDAVPLMGALAEANDPFSHLSTDYDGIRFAFRNTPPQFMPFLVWQLGLSELAPFLPNIYDLTSEGVEWQRVRGTPDAIARGLSWVGYEAILEEAPIRRRRWNRFQTHLDRVRDADSPDLRQIDGIVSLSPPARSRFSRGFKGYDVRAAETSYQRTSGSLTSDHSGVYLPGIGAKWSFGRRYEASHTMTETELTDLGTWIEPVTSGDLWADADYLWADADFAWAFPAAIARRNAIAAALIALGTPYIRFRAAGGAIIGHARAIAHGVTPALDGDYAFGPGGYDVTSTEVTGLMVVARTPFGAGAGQTATSMSIVFDGTRAVGIDPGALWVPPSGITGGVEVAATTVSIPFGLTVRERPLFLLTF